MTTVYARNFATGRDDRASNSVMTMPSSLVEKNAFQGYIDGYSGRVFKEPEAMKVEQVFKNFADVADRVIPAEYQGTRRSARKPDVLLATMVNTMNSLSDKCKDTETPQLRPSKDGSKGCESGSIASGGTRQYCTCDICF